MLTKLWGFEFLEGGLQIGKIGENWTSNFCFLFISPRRRGPLCTGFSFPRTKEPSAPGKQNLVQNEPRQRGENSPNLAQPISQPTLARCILRWQFED